MSEVSQAADTVTEDAQLVNPASRVSPRYAQAAETVSGVVSGDVQAANSASRVFPRDEQAADSAPSDHFEKVQAAEKSVSIPADTAPGDYFEKVQAAEKSVTTDNPSGDAQTANPASSFSPREKPATGEAVVIDVPPEDERPAVFVDVPPGDEQAGGEGVAVDIPPEDEPAVVIDAPPGDEQETEPTSGVPFEDEQAGEPASDVRSDGQEAGAVVVGIHPEDEQAAPPEDEQQGNSGIRRIIFKLITAGIEVSQRLIDAVASSAAPARNLGAIWGIEPYKAFIIFAIRGVFDVVRNYQEIRNITAGCLQFELLCFKDDRFLKILRDYELGKIEKRFKEEFSKVGNKTIGLEVEIKNKEEVERTKETIKNRYGIL